MDLPPLLRVGVCWASGRENRDLYADKSMVAATLLEPLLPACRAEDLCLVSLQVGEDAPQLEPFRSEPNLFDPAPALTSFADTAAVIAQLDLVITVDTAVAHLAGAMGKPTWVLLPFNADWRWLTERRDSPWYPSMRLYRQPRPGDWAAILAVVTRDLQAVLG